MLKKTPRYLVAGTILCLTAAGLVVAQGAALAPDQSGETARRVAEMVSDRHINHPQLDDALSARLLKRYIESLDPAKLYFLQKDIDGFETLKTELDDQIRAENIAFAQEAFDLLRKRMAERLEPISKFIAMDHDFTVEESMILSGDDRDWAKSTEELNERWRKRIKFDLLMLRLDDVEVEEGKERLQKRYLLNEELMSQTEPHEILEMYLSALTHCLDPHSSYMSPKTREDFMIKMRLELEGIGARLRFEDGYTIVEEVLKGGAAGEDGRLEAGDRIVGVDKDASGTFEDVVEMKLQRVVDRIRGPKGTELRLLVRKKEAKKDETEIIELTRSKVKLEDDAVSGKIIESTEWFGGPSVKVGILNIPSFYRDFSGASIGGNFKSTSRDVKEVLQRFRKDGVEVVVVDLRWNGGGALSEAIEVSGLFIPRGPMVQVREPNNSVTPYDDEDPDWYWRGPLVVVCNRMSASASEIFAGAIKDYNRGIVVGDSTTHGKGTVQNVMDVARGLSLFGGGRKDLGSLKLTISKFYRVNGDSTQTRGVASDIALPSYLDHRDLGEDSLDNALEFDQIQRARYSPFTTFRSDDVVHQVAQKSAARVEQDKEFQELNHNIEKYLERKKRKTVSLVESELRAEQEELKREQEEEEDTIKKASGVSEDKDIFADTFYNRELLSITMDYFEALRSVTTARNQ